MCKRRRAHIQKRNFAPILPTLLQCDMLRKPYIQKKVLFHDIICHFLLSDTGRRSVGEKMAKYYLGKKVKNIIMKSYSSTSL